MASNEDGQIRSRATFPEYSFRLGRRFNACRRMARSLAIGCRGFGGGIRQLIRWGELGRTFLFCGVAGISIYWMALFALPLLALPVKLGVQTVVFLAILVTTFLVTGHLNRDERELLWAPVRVVRGALRERSHRG